MRKISACILLVLLASVVPLAITSAAAYEKKIPCDADGDNELTKEELVNLKRKKKRILEGDRRGVGENEKSIFRNRR